MENELFLHQLGALPLLDRILMLLPVVKEELIPTSGVVGRDRMSFDIDASETYALLIEDRNHRKLFELLQFYSYRGGIGGEKMATPTGQSGTDPHTSFAT